MFSDKLNPRESWIEWPMWLSALGLLVISMAFVYSATSIYEPLGFWHQFHSLSWQSFFWWVLPKYYTRQMIAAAIGLGIAVVFCVVSYHKISRWSLVVYWGSILVLAGVLVQGIERQGAQRWIDLGFITFQPSEFAKLGVVLGLANFLSRPAEELASTTVVFQALGMIALPFVLILKEPDLGSALVLAPVGFAMMLTAGMPAVYLKRLVMLGVLLIGLMVADVWVAPVGLRIPLEQYQRQTSAPKLVVYGLLKLADLHDGILAQYQRERLLVYFGREFSHRGATEAERRKASERKTDKEYNAMQAQISVGSGGLTGKGWGEGTQNKLGFLPSGVAHNDFIFSVIAEEEGFVGSAVVLALYTLLLFTGIKIAGQARDRLGKLLAVGITILFFSHIFINIGMNIRLMPVAGIPLPLLSYGGTSVVCSLIAVGILQNIHLYRKS